AGVIRILSEYRLQNGDRLSAVGEIFYSQLRQRNKRQRIELPGFVVLGVITVQLFHRQRVGAYPRRRSQARLLVKRRGSSDVLSFAIAFCAQLLSLLDIK